ncbi:MAG: winged helix DNA-binding protein [Verrucomicrobium sp.]|nr:winged helix DNA-binding protein [Verrucomicrobium sp.]
MDSINVDNVKETAGAEAVEVFELIHSLMHLFRAEQYRALRGGPHDLSHMEGKVLGFFAERPGAMLRDAVLWSGRDKGQLARIIRTLKGQGLLAEQADPSDRRSVRLRATPEGRAIHLSLRRRLKRLSEAAVSGLGAKERREVARLLGKIKGGLLELGAAA